MQLERIYNALTLTTLVYIFFWIIIILYLCNWWTKQTNTRSVRHKSNPEVNTIQRKKQKVINLHQRNIQPYDVAGYQKVEVYNCYTRFKDLKPKMLYELNFTGLLIFFSFHLKVYVAKKMLIWWNAINNHTVTFTLHFLSCSLKKTFVLLLKRLKIVVVAKKFAEKLDKQHVCWIKTWSRALWSLFCIE